MGGGGRHLQLQQKHGALRLEHLAYRRLQPGRVGASLNKRRTSTRELTGEKEKTHYTQANMRALDYSTRTGRVIFVILVSRALVTAFLVLHSRHRRQP